MENVKSSANVRGEETGAAAKEGAAAGGCAVHSQVRRIQREDEGAPQDSATRRVVEPRPALRDLTRQLSRQPSRSRLARAG